MKNRRAKLPVCALQVEGRWEGRREDRCSASCGVCVGRAQSRSAVWKCCPASAGEVLPVNRAVPSLQGVLQKKKQVKVIPPPALPEQLNPKMGVRCDWGRTWSRSVVSKDLRARACLACVTEVSFSPCRCVHTFSSELWLSFPCIISTANSLHASCAAVNALGTRFTSLTSQPEGPVAILANGNINSSSLSSLLTCISLFD